MYLMVGVNKIICPMSSLLSRVTCEKHLVGTQIRIPSCISILYIILNSLVALVDDYHGESTCTVRRYI